jgi:hypothetical protein
VIFCDPGVLGVGRGENWCLKCFFVVSVSVSERGWFENVKLKTEGEKIMSSSFLRGRRARNAPKKVESKRAVSEKKREKEEKEIIRELHVAKAERKETEKEKEKVLVQKAASLRKELSLAKQEILVEKEMNKKPCYSPQAPPGLMFCSPEEILQKQQREFYLANAPLPRFNLGALGAAGVDMPFNQFSYRPPLSTFDNVRAFMSPDFNPTRTFEETYVLKLIPLKRAGFKAAPKYGELIGVKPAPQLGMTIPFQDVQPQVTAPGAAPPLNNILGVQRNAFNGQLEVLVKGEIGNIERLPWGPQFAPKTELSETQITYLTTLATLYHVVLSLNLDKIRKDQPLLVKTCTAYSPAQDTIVTLEAKLECLMYFLEADYKKQNLFAVPVLHRKWMSAPLQLLFYGDVIRNRDGQPQAIGNYMSPFSWKHSVNCKLKDENPTDQVMNKRISYRSFLVLLYSAIWRTWTRRTIPDSNNPTMIKNIDYVLAQQDPANFTVRFLETSIASLTCFLQVKGHEMYNTKYWFDIDQKFLDITDDAILLILQFYQYLALVPPASQSPFQSPFQS